MCVSRKMYVHVRGRCRCICEKFVKRIHSVGATELIFQN